MSKPTTTKAVVAVPPQMQLTATYRKHVETMRVFVREHGLPADLLNDLPKF